MIDKKIVNRKGATARRIAKMKKEVAKKAKILMKNFKKGTLG